MLHQLASNEVVSDASPVSILSVIQQMVAHVRRDRGADPEIIVEVHTHPSSDGMIGAPEPSEADKRSFSRAAETIKRMMPEACVFFGVHAVGEEGIRPRSAPRSVGGNGVRWDSITRAHEVRFFDQNARPVKVALHG